MIVGLPTAEDFYTSGKQLLDFAWDVSAKLLQDLDEVKVLIDSEDISDEYWAAAKGRLTTALSITQQGVEFILKGKIVAISPFLLLADAPSKWPSPYTSDSIKFSDFRTIDAQDLIRVIDTFSSDKLSPAFVNNFHLLREKRNKIMHSVDKDLAVNVTEVIDSILFMHKNLFPTENWPNLRVKFLEKTPVAELGANEYAINSACGEISLVIDLLPPARVKMFFGIDKKQKRYFCPECLANANNDVDFEYKLAVLKPKSPTSVNLYCPVCNATHMVIRSDCENCSGNVQSNDGRCLTCGNYC